MNHWVLHLFCALVCLLCFFSVINRVTFGYIFRHMLWSSPLPTATHALRWIRASIMELHRFRCSTSHSAPHHFVVFFHLQDVRQHPSIIRVLNGNLRQCGETRLVLPSVGASQKPVQCTVKLRRRKHIWQQLFSCQNKTRKFIFSYTKKKKKKRKISVLLKCHTDGYVVPVLAPVHFASVTAMDAAICRRHMTGLPNTGRLFLWDAWLDDLSGECQLARQHVRV